MARDNTESSKEVSEVEKVMMSRFANRFYLHREVDLEAITGILNAARYAATGGNVQPWRVYVLAGAAKTALADAIATAHETASGEHKSEYNYLPAPLPEPFASRRNEFASVFYGSLGIAQEDMAARAVQSARNCRFFDAPVGLIFTIDRRLEKGSWLDLGMFIQNIMLAAKARGLDTCTQEFLSRYHAVIRTQLPLAAEELVVCGMSMGFGDPEWARRRPQMPKAPLEEFASLHGF
ncbi:nitroreductase [Undibacterium terreum]|uniref:Nitroreductase n=1 Tax=Undibacterium terreum TaxID=1224302 RepID=A0A916UVK1_9BURK|nr:nitroreductase [Undibacterium terreum]GGC88828.1 nitroreductase [Undibacterium terreum]